MAFVFKPRTEREVLEALFDDSTWPDETQHGQMKQSNQK